MIVLVSKAVFSDMRSAGGEFVDGPRDVDAGCIDQNVHRAKVWPDVIYCPPDGGGIGQINGNGDDPLTVPPGFSGDLLNGQIKICL